MPSQERANLNGWDLSESVPPVPSVPLRLAGLDHAADAERHTRRVNNRILAAFPALRDELR